MPLKPILFSIIFLVFTPLHAKQIIMIDPAGDAKQTGRYIGNSLERAQTIKFAESLKQKLETKSFQVILTRSPGELVYPLQNANFSNRLPVTLYVSLHCYHNPQEKFALTIYRFSYNHMNIQQSQNLAMIPYDKAHLATQEKTKSYAHQIKQELNTEKTLQIHGVYALPFHPLIGIQAPAIGIEINLIHQNDWQIYLEPLAKSIIATLEMP